MSRSRNWVFTENFEDGEIIHPGFDLKGHNIRYYVYQIEKVDTIHLQGMVCFVNPRTLRGVKKILPRAHWEVMKGTFNQSRAYCTKEETRVQGPFEEGTPLNQGTRSDLDEIKELLLDGTITLEDAYIEYPAVMSRYYKYFEKIYSIYLKRQAHINYMSMKRREVVVLYGEAGTGKTSAVYKKFGLDDIYTLTFGDGSAGSLWFDDYCGEKVLLLDDFYGQIKYATLLRILDIYPLRVQVKGGYTHINFKYIYITSNSHYSEWYPGVDDTLKPALERRIHRCEKVTGPSITPSLVCQVDSQKDALTLKIEDMI